MSEEKLVPKLRFIDEPWGSQKLGKICKITMGQSPSSENYTEDSRDTVLIQGNADLINGKVVPRIFTSEITKLSYPGDIILTVRAPVGDLAINEFKSCIGRGVCSIKGNKFIYYFLQSLKDKHVWERLSQGSTFESINSNDIKNLNLKIPSKTTQESISDFLTLIDAKIELLEKKHESYIDFKKYLIQQIFAQKLRFTSSNDDWKTVKIKDIFDERNEKGFMDLELLSVTLKDGVIKRSEIEAKDNSNENKTNYKHVMPEDIVYNSMRMWQGASGVSSYEGIVSPAYTILIPKNVYSKFFGYYFKTAELIHQFKKYSQGLTSDTWNLKYPLISEIKIKIPSIEEQKEITKIFETIDMKLEIIQNNLEEMAIFKKGLLQQMFVYTHIFLNFCAKICCIKYFLKFKYDWYFFSSNSILLSTEVKKFAIFSCSS